MAGDVQKRFPPGVRLRMFRLLENFGRAHWTKQPAMCLLGVELLTVEVSSPIAAKAVHGRLPVVPSDMP